MNSTEMKPLWAEYPNAHPYSIHWRMGGGESYAMAFYEWWRDTYASAPIEERLAFVQRHPFRPAWTEHAIEMVWRKSFWELPDDQAAQQRQHYFALAAQHGFPTWEETEHDLNRDDWSDL